jgi:hypothetical protein
VDLDDPGLWARANPALGLGRVTHETILRLRRMLSAREGRGFAREVLGLWPKQRVGGGAIDPALWAELFDKDSKREGDVTIAVDIAPDRSYTSIALYGTRTDGRGHMQIVAYAAGTDWVLPAIVTWRDAINPIAIAMARGTAASLEVELEKRGIHRPEEVGVPKRGDLAVANATEMTAATGQFLDGIRQRTERWTVSANEAGAPLDTSVRGAAAKQTGDSLVWARKESFADTSPLVSVTLARWAYHSLAHLIDQVVDEPPPNVW